MPESTPTNDILAQLTEAIEEAETQRSTFCGCPGQPPTADRMCLFCSKPNLQAMIEWRADECTCSPPNNMLGTIQLRSCRTCDKPVFGERDRPRRRRFLRRS
jgi:hypothetical protein